jgi:hypothetical protein
MTWGFLLYFPSKGWCGVQFYCPQKSIFSAKFEPANLEFNGKHANHYATKVT